MAVIAKVCDGERATGQEREVESASKRVEACRELGMQVRSENHATSRSCLLGAVWLGEANSEALQPAHVPGLALVP